MVNGAGPYEGKELSLFELYEKIVNTDLKISNSKFDVVIKEATKKDVNMRIQNCELFRLSLIDASANTSRRNNQRINYRYYNY